jgi:hypothetical protein
LFIDEFDALVNMLWSTCDTVKEEAQKELKKYMKSTMCTMYDLLKEDCIHNKPIKSKKIHELEQGNFLDQSGILEKSKIEVCRILPTAVCKKITMYETQKVLSCFQGIYRKM